MSNDYLAVSSATLGSGFPAASVLICCSIFSCGPASPFPGGRQELSRCMKALKACCGLTEVADSKLVAISMSLMVISPARRATSSKWYRINTAMVAAIGTAKNAPITPNVADPKVTDSRTIAACRFMARDWSMGCKILPSTCCTTKITTTTMMALVRPLDTKAIMTANVPANSAPTIGMKPPKNVITARTKARGTLRITRPMPMKIASTSEMIAWVRTKPARVFQIRLSSSVKCQPTFGPAARRIMGRKLVPSFKKKKVRTSISMRVTTIELAAEIPVKTLEAMPESRSWRKDVTSLRTFSNWPRSRFSGGP